MKNFKISLGFILFSLFIASDEEIIRNSLEKILPAGSEIESIQESSIPGLYSCLLYTSDAADDTP